MKNIIGAIILVAVLGWAFMHGLEKTIDNRCDYYRTLDMTEVMKQTCEEK
ncbi:MAG TPA: hypothetical protein VIU13_14320 [Chryseolinea sp.]